MNAQLAMIRLINFVFDSGKVGIISCAPMGCHGLAYVSPIFISRQIGQWQTPLASQLSDNTPLLYSIVTDPSDENILRVSSCLSLDPLTHYREIAKLLLEALRYVYDLIQDIFGSTDEPFMRLVRDHSGPYQLNPVVPDEGDYLENSGFNAAWTSVTRWAGHPLNLHFFVRELNTNISDVRHMLTCLEDIVCQPGDVSDFALEISVFEDILSVMHYVLRCPHYHTYRHSSRVT